MEILEQPRALALFERECSGRGVESRLRAFSGPA